MSDKCANCGADEGLHHYQTSQCPSGGTEAPVGQKEFWMDTTFLSEEDKPLARKEVQAMISEAIQNHVDNYDHVDLMEEHDY